MDVRINELRAILVIPQNAIGIVVFAHGSGSGRLSPRNQFVASFLQQNGLGTLLVDLLTEEEERIDDQTRQFRFDIDLLAERLEECTAWLRTQSSLPIGYFGASTGAAAALLAADDSIKAIVSRGGRPDLALDALAQVKAATLLIVGGDDLAVIELNKKAYDALTAEKRLEIVPGATHLFEEPGALEIVSRLASDWFTKYLGEK
ncbi:MAG: dienelactone hydrolase family protein [Verrucomicrobia bacterium]|nr:dienelactone hydrolase family protein [Verrucomicrobiota bacterium]